MRSGILLISMILLAGSPVLGDTPSGIETQGTVTNPNVEEIFRPCEDLLFAGPADLGCLPEEQNCQWTCRLPAC